MAAASSEHDHDLFENLVEELLKDKPDSKKVKLLCNELGIHYVKNHADQIEDILRNGSKVYLSSRAKETKPKLDHGKNL